MPRTLGSQMSPMTPPELVIGLEAAIPPRRRKMRMLAVLLDSAQPTWNPVYRMKAMMKRYRRPKTSDMGPQSRGPTQYL